MSGTARITQQGRLVQAFEVSAGKSFHATLAPGTYKITLPGAGYYVATVKAAKTTTLPVRACT